MPHTLIAGEGRAQAAECAAPERGQGDGGPTRRWTPSRIPPACGVSAIGRISGRQRPLRQPVPSRLLVTPRNRQTTPTAISPELARTRAAPYAAASAWLNLPNPSATPSSRTAYSRGFCYVPSKVGLSDRTTAPTTDRCSVP